MDVGKLRGGGSERGASWSAAAAGAREEAFGPAARPRGEAGSGCAVCPGTGSGGRGFDAPDAGEADFCGREANGCSAGSFGRHGKVNSEQLNWSQSHKDMVMMIQEMKRCLPEDKRSSSKPSTISALNYALRCVQQVQANNDFFQALSDRRVFQTDVVTYSVEELVAVASEHTPKNTDTFVAVFSLLSGRMVHISEQAASILNCKKKLLDSSRFVELLVPQDVSVFYTHTDQSHLPLWNMESQTASLYEYAQVKSFFCRIRSGKDEETRYYPFRITPYLVHVCTSVHVDTESCCLALAEKIHSGYEAPRIPMDKRIFTTTHTPGCVFLDIDDRAVPLLGYLPQDLIGTSILMYLHPEDRPLMVAIHRKILKFAGQPPFEHLPIRFCTQNGDYVILDTSWSSFVNPWSRKVVFIIGRHKVRTSPLNEDVFAARSKETSRVEKEIRELQGQIYKLLLQPVHSNVSSGYGSRGSNGSYEHYMSIASSSDSNGNCAEDIQEPMTLQQVCADVNRIKNLGQQLYIASRSKPQNGNEQAVSSEILGGKRHTASCSLQTLRSDSTEEPGNAFYDGSKKTPSVPSYQQINCVDSIIRYLESCSIPALKRKCKSSANTSSSSSEDDKQVQQSHQEAEALEDTAILSAVNSQTPVSADQEETLKDKTAAGMVGAPLADLTLSNKAPSVVSVTSQCSYSSTIVHVPHPESEVTTMEDTTAGSEQIELPPVNAQNLTVVPEDLKPVGLTKETLSVHTQKEEQNYVDKFRQRILLSPFRTYLQQGSRNNKGHSRGQGDSTSKQMSPSSCKKGKHGKSKRQKPQRKLSDNHSTSKNRNSLPCVKRTIQKQSFSPSEVSCLSSSNTNVLPPVGFPVCLDPLSSFPASSVGEELAIHSLKPEPMSSSQLRCGAQSCPAFYPPNIGTFMAVFFQSFPMYAQMPQYVFLPSPQYVYLPSSYPCTVLPPAPPPPAPSPVAPHAADQPFPVSFATSMEDQQEGQCAQALLLSSSRSSSPLQLNLLQEELPKPMELFTSTDVKAHAEAKCDNDPEDSVNSANCCASSEFTDHLLYEGSLSGAGSAASGSGSALSVSSGSSSNETSGSGTGSGKSTKYFPSNDSSEASKEKNQEAEEKGTAHKSSHESAWMMMDHTPEQVLMTYQMPNRCLLPAELQRKF
ncbi:period circadian protein homolog 3 isoform X7 [Strigops habroptila]|uniref:period circadian protein homolog 3 isoform X7 n=1 Tax=Strigops habroptila TaxID=2489341 RepID=UPI0011D01B5D|nr:period circadian protein homolog 3 isoform X7 [Strigops habroptila]